MSEHALPLKIAPAHERSGSPSNAWFLGSIRVSIPNGISIGVAVFAQLKADAPHTLRWVPLSPKKIALPTRGSGPPSKTWFLGPIQPKTPTASQSAEPFLHSSPQNVPIFYNGPPLPPSKLPFPWGIWTLSNTWPTRVLNPNGILIGSAVFAGFTTVCPWTLFTGNWKRF